jgi:hypothetical protein
LKFSKRGKNRDGRSGQFKKIPSSKEWWMTPYSDSGGGVVIWSRSKETETPLGVFCYAKRAEARTGKGSGNGSFSVADRWVPESELLHSGMLVRDLQFIKKYGIIREEA